MSDREERLRAYAGGKWASSFTPRSAGERRYWLVKSEPSSFSWDDLVRAPGSRTHWDGIRNFAARNFLRDGMEVGDRAFYYHSMADPQAIVGIAEVVREAYPDHTQFERGHPGADPDSDPADPTWYMVDLRAVEPLPRPVSLPELKARPELASMALLRIGRLSVTPVTPTEWETIVAMAGDAPAEPSAAERPVGRTGAARKSAAKRPAAKTPAAKKPAAKAPAAKKSAATKRAAEKPAAKTPPAKKPAAGRGTRR